MLRNRFQLDWARMKPGAPERELSNAELAHLRAEYERLLPRIRRWEGTAARAATQPADAEDHVAYYHFRVWQGFLFSARLNRRPEDHLERLTWEAARASLSREFFRARFTRAKKDQLADDRHQVDQLAGDRHQVDQLASDRHQVDQLASDQLAAFLSLPDRGSSDPAKRALVREAVLFLLAQLPKRTRSIILHLSAGHSSRAIARAYGLDPRSVWRIRSTFFRRFLSLDD
jgi:hypothetical protein